MLKTYRAKRNFSKTPEPRGEKMASGKDDKALTFVVQEHAASRLHFDFRLEFNGILLSWAVPKGPSLNPNDKRLAVMTEDHPLDYAGFEGIIPSGYGAGEVIVWDNGTYEPLDENEQPISKQQAAEKTIKAGLKSGKLSFVLYGKKLQGIWTLVQIKGKDKGKDWLLIKHKDEYAGSNSHPWQDKSVLSDTTLADLQVSSKKRQSDGAPKSKPSKTQLTSKITETKSKLGQKKKTVNLRLPPFIPPMLATLATDTFKDDEWSFEPKLDGIRALAYISKNEAQIYSRRGLVITPRYPNLIDELSQHSVTLVLDGEIIALDENQRPSFEKLQERSGLTKAKDILDADKKNAVIYYVFDILYCDGEDLSSSPLCERKTYLHSKVANSTHIKLIEELGSDGAKAFKACMDNGLEGVVGKRLKSSYQSGRRSADWLKIKSTNSAEFLICGYTKGTGSRDSTFGALILGEHDKSGELVHVGNVGTGFDNKKLSHLLKTINTLKTQKCPFANKPSNLGSPTWVKPNLVAEIKYAERTKSGHLRVPVFMHLRDDIDPAQVIPPKVIKIPSSKKNRKSELH